MVAAAGQSLMLHCGGVKVDREGLRGFATPEPTKTHCPIAHYDLVGQTIEKIEGLGVKVDTEVHGVSHEGNRYFGVFGLGGDADGGYGLVVGLRNSHDKSFQASLALGTHVFVCDNLSFSGEVTIARKHTRWILRDLPGLMAGAVNKIVGARRTMEERVEAYKHQELTDMRAHDLVVRALDAKVISPMKMQKVLKEWRQPRFEDFEPRTAWSLFNSFTEALKDYKAEGIYERSQPLHGIFDAACGLAIAV